jgi:hypothetical protein
MVMADASGAGLREPGHARMPSLPTPARRLPQPVPALFAASDPVHTAHEGAPAVSE